MKKSLILIGSFLVLTLISFSIVQAQNPIEQLVNLLQQFLNLQKTATSSFEPQPQVIYKPVAEYEQAVIKAVEKVSPAVVSIIISKDVPVFEQYYQKINPFEEFWLPPEFKGLIPEFKIPQFRQKGFKKKKIGGGTGFIISPDGLIATNKHVIADSKAEYTVYLNDGRKFKGKVVALHPIDDLGILKIKANNLPTVVLGDSSNLKLGQTAIAIGNALGEFQNTVSVGVISGLKRTITASDQKGNFITLENLIQTDAAINFGNSGGPLINLYGEVIGINTAIVSGAQNIGFAIPVNRLKKMINQIKASGEVKLPYLGIRYILITPEFAEKYNLPSNYGAYVFSDDPGKPAILANSPAEKAGLRERDIILEVDGQKITPTNSLSFVISQKSIGEKVKLKILRGKKTIYLWVVLEKRPKNL